MQGTFAHVHALGRKSSAAEIRSASDASSRRPAATVRATHAGIGLGALGAAPAMPGTLRSSGRGGVSITPGSHRSVRDVADDDDDEDDEEDPSSVVLREAAARREAVDAMLRSGMFGPGAAHGARNAGESASHAGANTLSKPAFVSETPNPNRSIRGSLDFT